LILAVLIPVYNEERLIEQAVARLDAVPETVGPGGTPVRRRLFIVDDGSTDLTRDALQRLATREDVMVLHHGHNQGKGAAIRTALAAALAWRGTGEGESAEKAELFIIHDADLEYDPRDHEAMLDPMLDATIGADAVIGSRFLGLSHRVLYFWHSLANRFITTVSNVCTNLNLSDIECCFKAFTRRVAERLRIEEDRFGVEPEIVAKIAGMRVEDEAGGGGRGRERPLRVYEVAVSYAGRTYAEGKKIGWKDGFSALWCIVKYNLMR
jgi:glycosyltransferase involved in cell wall biosynthesis